MIYIINMTNIIDIIILISIINADPWSGWNDGQTVGSGFRRQVSCPNPSEIPMAYQQLQVRDHWPGPELDPALKDGFSAGG